MMTEDKIISLICSVFKQKKTNLKNDTPLEEFAHDSMDIIEFIAILKNKYSVVIEPEELAKLRTISEIVAYILKHQATSKIK